MTSARDYFEQHYRTDFEQFGADSLCGANLAEIMRPPRRGASIGLAGFILCQFTRVEMPIDHFYRRESRDENAQFDELADPIFRIDGRFPSIIRTA